MGLSEGSALPFVVAVVGMAGDTSEQPFEDGIDDGCFRLSECCAQVGLDVAGVNGGHPASQAFARLGEVDEYDTAIGFALTSFDETALHEATHDPGA